MKVILLKEVKGLGKTNDIVDVSDGYAHNFLIRKQLALESTPANLNVVKTRKQAEAARAAKELADARTMAAQLQGQVFIMKMKCGEGGRLYGALTVMDVASALAKAGFKVDKRGITIKQVVKSLGEFDADIRLHTEVTAKVQIKVIAE